MTGSSKLPDVLAGFTSHLVLAKGDVVFRANAPARHVFFLAQGRVVLHRFGPTGEEVVIHVALAGEFFAEASLHSDRYHCTAVSMVDGEGARIAAADLRARLRGDPAFAMEWLAIVSRQLRQTRARVERLSLKSAAERVRHLLVTEGRGARPTYALRGTVKELASELGLTHEALYRTLATMERDGVVARDDKRLVLKT
ncbi:MAG: Crp/Fnr family transcriptional regulator [Methylibium sp.]